MPLDAYSVLQAYQRVLDLQVMPQPQLTPAVLGAYFSRALPAEDRQTLQAALQKVKAQGLPQHLMAARVPALAAELPPPDSPAVPHP
jgi:hypothetical protein